MSSADARQPRARGGRKVKGRHAYSDLMDRLGDEDPKGFETITGYVRELRAECAAARVKLREAHDEIAYLEGMLDGAGVKR